MVRQSTATGQPRGRESLLTPRRVETVIAAIERGNFIATAASLAGISKTTYQTWRRRGENELRRIDALEGYDAVELVDQFLSENTDEDEQLAPLKDIFASWTDPVFDQKEWPYVLFAVLLERARAKFIDKTVTDIADIGTNATKPQWQALKWLLEMTNPEQYGAKNTVTLQGNPENPLVHEVVSPEALLARLQELRSQKDTPAL